MKYGIVTHYYNSVNYGGILQAYALCRVCNKLGYETEQICYYDNSWVHKLASLVHRIVLRETYFNRNNFKIRIRAIKEFRDLIPHSRLYMKGNLKKANQKYDGFIVGSDQVWNPAWLNQAFKLEFVNDDKNKVAYGVSLGREKLNSTEKDIYRFFLDRINYVSVREESAVSILSELTNKEIDYVLDPTLLLGVSEWDQLIPEKMIDENYVFCYFLGNNEVYRDVVRQYSEKYKKKIVTLPFLSYSYRKCDVDFGDYQLYDVAPQKFISLIKYADCVFTDSFHASLFSNLYKREFFAFSQDENQSKGRIDSLTKLFGTENRHIVGDKKLNLSYIESVKQIDYQGRDEKLEYQRNISIEFLKNALSVSGV